MNFQQPLPAVKKGGLVTFVSVVFKKVVGATEWQNRQNTPFGYVVYCTRNDEGRINPRRRLLVIYLQNNFAFMSTPNKFNINFSLVIVNLSLVFHFKTLSYCFLLLDFESFSESRNENWDEISYSTV